MNNYKWNNAFPDTPESFKNKVSATLGSLPDKKENDEMENKKIYKKGSIKKKVIIALVATMLVGTTVFAAGKICSITSIMGSSKRTYTTMPTAAQVKKDFKFNPKLVDKFDNGYTFSEGSTDKQEGRDEKGNCVAKSKALDFTYKKGNDELSLSMDNGWLDEIQKKPPVIANYSGIDLYYASNAYKFVPADYKLTEQDKQDESSGKYVFSYGADKVKISQVQYLNWKQDGINYSFTAIDSKASKDELVKMAQQVINSKYY